MGGVAGLLLYAACFPHRLEYAAHLLAGMGLAALGVAATRSVPVGQVLRSIIVLGGVLIAAVAAELTFSGPGVETLDVANTVMGGAMGLVAVLGSSDGESRPTTATSGEAAWGVATAGTVLVVVGMVLRYVVQPTAKHWWWFGTWG